MRLLLAAIEFATAPLAMGQVYTGIVQYPLPSGFEDTSGPSVSDVSAGQTVGYGTNNHALLWSAAGVVDLNPNPTYQAKFISSVAVATGGTEQVGYGEYSNNFVSGGLNPEHALLWTGTAASAVDLNPIDNYFPRITNSFATATNGTQQVGWGDGPNTEGDAILWTGTAASAVDLNPPRGFISSYAYGTDGSQQVGYGYASGTANYTHAMLWTGTAASAVDLNPTNLSGIQYSEAFGVNGNQQVGYGIGSGTGDYSHAMLWTGTAAGAVDLNPTNLSGIAASQALSTNGTQQVGSGWNSEGLASPPPEGQALLWTSTAASAVNLQALLPSAGIWSFSQACTIDSFGDIYGYAEGTFNNVSGFFAVEWSPPTALTWNNAGGTGDGHTWDAYFNQNWDNSVSPAFFHAGDNVTFNDSNNGNYAVTLNTTVSPASVTVNNSSGNYVISGTGGAIVTGAFAKSGADSLTLGSALTASSLTISGGTMRIAPNTTLGSGSVTSSISLSSLSITGDGVLDITNNHIIINYGSGPDPISSIATMIASGYDGGTWNGMGILSSAAQSNANYGIGYADSADPGNPAGLASGQIEIAYTLLGDANLDGKVNGTDFNILAANFNTGGDSWDQGDFTYDGKVNGSDFNLLAANFNQGATQSADLNALESFAAANGLSADVPEPMSAGLMVMAGLGVLRRRRSAVHE